MLAPVGVVAGADPETVVVTYEPREETWTVTVLANEDFVAMVGDQPFETLQAAINAANAGDTVILGQDVTEDITISKSITLDLDGHTLRGGAAEAAMVAVEGDVTVLIQDGTLADKEGRIAGVVTSSGADLTLSNCVLSGHYVNKTTGAVVVADGGSLTMDGCVVESNTDSNYYMVMGKGDAALTLTDTRFQGNTASKAVVKLEGDASLAMTGGTFSGNESNGAGGTLHAETTGTVDLTGVTFTESAGSSPAVYVKNAGGLALKDVTVTGYAPSNNKHVVHVEGGCTVEAEVLTLQGNTTAGNGSILYLKNTGTNTLTNCVISDNQAGGSTISVAKTAEATFQSCTIADNTAGGYAGGIDAKGIVTVKDSLIQKNCGAHMNGTGGLYVASGAQVSAENTVIKENVRTSTKNPDSYAGGVYVVSGGSFTMAGGALYGNVDEVGSGKADDLFSNGLVDLPAANAMVDGDLDFSGYSWLDNGNPVVGAIKKNGLCRLTAKIYSTQNVQIIREGAALEPLYADLYSALKAAQAGDVLKLVSPAGTVNFNETNGNSSQDKDLTIDFNGQKVLGGHPDPDRRGRVPARAGGGRQQQAVRPSGSGRKCEAGKAPPGLWPEDDPQLCRRQRRSGQPDGQD